uniref:NADH dehydrogenase subunit 6 n=1 Tax=Laelaps nuttalli TaxID=2902835 RepID=A0AAU6QE22_9ACAR
MKFFILFISLFLMNHPVSMIIYLLSISIIFLILILFIFKSSWFSLVFMLMMLGGLMVLFIYMASLSSNEYFKFNKGWNFYLLMLMMYIPLLKFDFGFSEYLMVNLFNMNSMLMFMLYIIYLFVILILIIEILLFVKSSLRIEI